MAAKEFTEQASKLVDDCASLASVSCGRCWKRTGYMLTCFIIAKYVSTGTKERKTTTGKTLRYDTAGT